MNLKIHVWAETMFLNILEQRMPLNNVFHTENAILSFHDSTQWRESKYQIPIDPEDIHWTSTLHVAKKAGIPG